MITNGQSVRSCGVVPVSAPSGFRGIRWDGLLDGQEDYRTRYLRSRRRRQTIYAGCGIGGASAGPEPVPKECPDAEFFSGSTHSTEHAADTLAIPCVVPMLN